MDKERTVIDQKLCDTVRMMMAGKDAKVSQVVELLGISQATVNRIRQAGYSMEQFNKDKSNRNERKKELKEKRAEDTRTIIGKYIAAENAKKTNIPTMEQLEAALAPGAGIERALAAANQIEGQMEMDLRPAEEKKNSNNEMEQLLSMINSRMKVTDELLEKVIENQSSLLKYIAGKTNLLGGALGKMIDRIERQNDFLGQILRRMDK